jgi:hypothetical protein
MFTYFMDLNKCCPKDNFPLTRIDKIVDSAVGYEMMALLNCFQNIIKFVFTKKISKRQSS